MPKWTCQQCGVEFPRETWRTKRSKHQFCSYACFTLYQSAFLRANPELVGQKIMRDCTRCGTPFRVKFKYLDTAKFCSKECLYDGGFLDDYEGDANPNYRHGQHSLVARNMAGRYLLPECAICGWVEASCDVHHIVPKSKGGINLLDNLIVICPNHHRLAKTGAYTEEQLRAFTALARSRRRSLSEKSSLRVGKPLTKTKKGS